MHHHHFEIKTFFHHFPDIFKMFGISIVRNQMQKLFFCAISHAVMPKSM